MRARDLSQISQNKYADSMVDNDTIFHPNLPSDHNTTQVFISILPVIFSASKMFCLFCFGAFLFLKQKFESEPKGNNICISGISKLSKQQEINISKISLNFTDAIIAIKIVNLKSASRYHLM